MLSEDIDASDPNIIFEVGNNFVFDFSANDRLILNAFDILDISESSNPTLLSYTISEKRNNSWRGKLKNEHRSRKTSSLTFNFCWKTSKSCIIIN